MYPRLGASCNEVAFRELRVRVPLSPENAPGSRLAPRIMQIGREIIAQLHTNLCNAALAPEVGWWIYEKGARKTKEHLELGT